MRYCQRSIAWIGGHAGTTQALWLQDQLTRYKNNARIIFKRIAIVPIFWIM
jgi:hypothetical protein